MNRREAFLIVTLVAFLVIMVSCVLATSWGPSEATETNTKDLSYLLFNEYGLAVVIVGIVLFVSMLGGIFIAQEEKE
jgi:NADH:ubiquinone oxidoreductase subunit 6 (subunit J)